MEHRRKTPLVIEPRLAIALRTLDPGLAADYHEHLPGFGEMHPVVLAAHGLALKEYKRSQAVVVKHNVITSAPIDQ